MTEFAAPIADLARSGTHRRGQEAAPKPYRPEIEPTFRKNATEVLQKLQVAFVGCLSPGGWPTGMPVHFVSFTDEGERPILYFSADGAGALVANMASNPRVTVEAHYAVSFEERRQTRAVQLQGLATIVDDAGKIAEVRAALAAKYAQEPGFVLKDGERIIRIDVLSLVFFYPMGRPQWGFIDYV